MIPEEFETSIEIFSRVLSKYLIPRNEIEKMVADARAEGYQMFRTLSQNSLSFTDLTVRIPDLDISVWRIEPQAPIVGNTIDQVKLRSRYGLTLLAVQRGETAITNPGADTVIEAEDRLVILAKPARLSEACHLFRLPGKGDDAACDVIAPGS